MDNKMDRTGTFKKFMSKVLEARSEDVMKQFRIRLVDAMKTKEMPRRKLSELSGVSQSAINLLIAGSVMWPRERTAKLLADGLGVDVNWLLYGTGIDPTWIIWSGGSQPVDDGVTVEIRLRGDATLRTGIASNWHWSHNDDPSDIVAYRVSNGVSPNLGTPGPAQI